MTNNALADDTSTAKKATNLVDFQLSQIYQIPLEFSLSDLYRNFQMKNDVHGVLAVKNDLKNCMLMNTFLEDIYLYFYGDDYLISPTTTTTISGFGSIIYEYENWQEEQFKKDVNSTVSVLRGEEPVMYLKALSWDQITFLMPIGYINGAPYANLLVILRSEQITNLLDYSGLNKETDFMIINGNDDNLIYSSLDKGFWDDPTLRDIVNGFDVVATDGTRTDEAMYVKDGVKYHVAQNVSSTNLLRYISVTPMEVITAQVSQIRLFSIISIALLIGIVLLLISYFLNRNYNPIKNLRQFSQQLVAQHDEENHFLNDEIGEIKHCLEYLNHNNQTLQKEVHDGKSSLRSCIIFDLLMGGFPDVNLFKSVATRANMYFKNKLYVVAVIYSKSYTPETATKIISYIESKGDPKYIIYCHRHFENDKIILVINLNSEDKELLRDNLETINTSLAERYSIHPTIGCGKCYEKVNDIPKSFLEASTAANYRLLRGGYCVIFYDECIPNGDIDQIILPNEMERLGKFIIAGDYIQAKRFLDDIKNRLQTAQIPIYVVKSICFDVVGELKRAAASIFTLPSSYCEAPDLLEHDTIDELFDIIDAICVSLCNAVVDISQEKHNSKIDSMILYIKNNCKNPDFSTDKMAEDFSQSSSALCQYFKQKTGKTTTDYLVEFRISRAKEMLVTTNFPLTQIAYEIGYYNVSSFIRRFKQMVGCSPGVFRESGKD